MKKHLFTSAGLEVVRLNCWDRLYGFTWAYLAIGRKA